MLPRRAHPLAWFGISRDASSGPFRRLGWVAVGILILYLGLAGRLFQIQVLDHAKLRGGAEQQRASFEVRPHRRGGIFARNGEPLVISYAGWDLCVRVDRPMPIGAKWGSLEERARIVARALKRPVSAVLARLERLRANPRIKWVEIGRGLTDPGIVGLAKKHPEWMTLNHCSVRLQPRFPLAEGLLGRYGRPKTMGPQDNDKSAASGRHMIGLEASLDGLLVGRDTRLRGSRDGRGTPLVLAGEQCVEQRGHPGADVILTLDCEVQEVVERVLEEITARYQPVPGAGAVVLDARTGEILALASRPCAPDPTAWPYQQSVRLDTTPWMLPLWYAVSPGSTFKPFTVGEALSGPNPVRMHDLVDCGKPAGTRGPLRVGRRSVRNYKEKRHGDVTVEQALYCSYNVGMARLADRMGLARMVGLFARMGFENHRGDAFRLRTSAAWRELGRQTGQTSRQRNWRPGISPVSWSFGQEMALTLLDLAYAYTAIATDGCLREPVLVRRVVRPKGKERNPAAPDFETRTTPQRLFSAPIAAALRAALHKGVVADGGTLNWLYREHRELFGDHLMAAKTGTATEENRVVMGQLATPRYRRHSENVLNLMVIGPVGAGEARYIVALTAPHPRAKNKKYVSAGRVLGRYGVEIMRFLLDRDRRRGERPTPTVRARRDNGDSNGERARARGARA